MCELVPSLLGNRRLFADGSSLPSAVGTLATLFRFAGAGELHCPGWQPRVASAEQLGYTGCQPRFAGREELDLPVLDCSGLPALVADMSAQVPSAPAPAYTLGFYHLCVVDGTSEQLSKWHF